MIALHDTHAILSDEIYQHIDAYYQHGYTLRIFIEPYREPRLERWSTWSQDWITVEMQDVIALRDTSVQRGRDRVADFSVPVVWEDQ